MDYATGITLLDLERGHLLRLGAWAVFSILVGSALYALAHRGVRRGLWEHAGIQCIAWGAVDLGIVGWASRGLVPRDLPGAIALDRFLWLNIGLDLGYVMVGATLLVFGARLRRDGLIGAGLAIAVQGLTLVVLDVKLSALIVR